MNTARKVILAITVGVLGIALAGCSVSFDETENTKPGTSASPGTSGGGNSSDPNSSATPGANSGTDGSETTEADDATTIPAPRPLPKLVDGDKPTYGDATVTSSLAAIIANSATLSETKGWYATINGKVVGATSKAAGNNTSYAIAPFSVFPSGKAVTLPAGFASNNLLFVTTADTHNAFASLLGILTPNGGTLTTFDAKQSPLSEALFAAATVAPSNPQVKPTTVKYGTSKSFGKYGSTANAFSVVLNPGTAGAFSEVTLWVEKVGGKEVIVGVNDVRVGYGPHPSVESGIEEYAVAIKSSDVANSPMALGRISRFWVDMTTLWLSR